MHAAIGHSAAGTGRVNPADRSLAGRVSNADGPLPCTQRNEMHVPEGAASDALAGGAIVNGMAQRPYCVLNRMAMPMAVDAADTDDAPLTVVRQVAPWLEAVATVGVQPTCGLQLVGCSAGSAVSVVVVHDGQLRRSPSADVAHEHLPHEPPVEHHSVKRKHSHLGSGIGGQAKPSLVQPAADRVWRCAARRHDGTTGPQLGAH
jgi:hypothetical protein